jgi:hypothetical protein
LIELACEEQLFFKHLANRLVLIIGYNFNPLLETFPLPKQNEEVILTYLIKSLHFLEPFLHGYKLGRLRINKLAYSLAAKCIVVLDLLVDYLRISYNLHIIMIVLTLSDHVDELVCSQLLLSNHFEKGSNLVVCDLYLSRLWFRWDKGR